MCLPAYYLLFILLLIYIFWHEHQKKQTAFIKQQILSKRTEKEQQQMIELAKQFIGKECLIYTLNAQLNGTITAVTEGAIALENDKTKEIVNLDYIIRIREYPKNKNGKKKSVVFD